MALWNVQSPEDPSPPFKSVASDDLLAEFDVPLTFTFKGRANLLFLANLCALGVGISRYLVSTTTPTKVLDLKNGMISLRSAVLSPPMWLVDVAADGTVSKAWRVTESELPKSIIPSVEALLTEELEQEQGADDKLAAFARSGNDAEVAFDGAPVESHTIDASLYGRFWQMATELFADICESMEVKIPSLKLGMTHESSYGVGLKMSTTTEEGIFEIFGNERAHDEQGSRQAFEYLMSMIVDDQPSNDALVLIKRFHPLRQKYGNILELMSKNSAEVTIRTRGNPRARTVSGQKAGERLHAVRVLGYPYMNLQIRGRLIGGLVEKHKKTDRNFVIVVAGENQPTQDFKGPISESAVPEVLDVRLGDEVEATLQIQEEAGKDIYTLMHIERADPATPHAVK